MTSTPKTAHGSIPRPGCLIDYISGREVEATPEEVDAVQVFSQRLVEEYSYARDQIQTHPQFRVRKRPSDEAKSYPVDIAVFRSRQKTEDELLIVVECKNKDRKKGIGQLKLYMDMSSAEVGVWYNGEDHAYLRKIVHRDGRRTYDPLPNIPRSGERIQDIGKYRKKDLIPPTNLKATFRDMRNHLAGHATGITRDEALAQELISLLFCKIYDEINTGEDEIVAFRCGFGEDPELVCARIVGIFEQVKRVYSDVFTTQDTINLDSSSIVYVVGELHNYRITQADRDAVGEAFEVFIGPALRGAEGQFFTPRNVVRMMTDILAPGMEDTILDPACGSGGFLVVALAHVWEKLDALGNQKGWDPLQLDRWKRDLATRQFRGIDKDTFLAKVTKAYMAIIGDGRGGVFCDNSLVPVSEWKHETRDAIQLGTFDVVLTNPPFGSKIRISGEDTLSQYDLAHRWRKNKETGEWTMASELQEDKPPQLLFLERCIRFVRPGGRVGILLPESILGNPSYEYVVAWLLETVRLLAVVIMPEPLFKTSGKGGTHTKVCMLFLQNTPPTLNEDYDIFMAEAKWCGHDSRGNPTIQQQSDGARVLLDDVPTIAERYRRLMVEGDRGRQDHLGFCLKLSQIRNRILVPKYYDPELAEYLVRLTTTHDLLRMGDLVRDGVLHITTGVEVGKMAYNTGRIPFVRTSDIANWELKLDPKQGISEGLYDALKDKLDVQSRDILMVRDGTYLIGASTILTDNDVRIVYQSHIYKIRVLKPDILDPWLLFACLNTPVVKRQIRAKQFTQDIIDTLGNRLFEILVPLPRDDTQRRQIADATREVVETRARLREEARQIAAGIEGARSSSEEELLEVI